MLSGYVFVASPDVPLSTRATVRLLGGAVVDELTPLVTHGLVAAAGRAESLSCLRRLRGLRLPIVRADWVRASHTAGRPLPTRQPLAAHDPDLFASLRFTTTRVPAAIRENVVAAILFFGGAYEADMTTETNVLVHGLRGGAAAAAVVAESPKGREAAARGVPCVSVAWLQDCISAGRRLPLPTGTEREEETGAVRRKHSRLDSVVERIVSGRESSRQGWSISQIEEELRLG